eukprot:CAMPEP_0174355928 /NCGR_PEP_ID=MMETSP0811_2-20130205/27671_1 /TAXON_ID=73025 ORGANISM="Eutreptiella gymnastica-like, Strain CCMP1594" /NCGR_SAMPLE_ID=MMETSP0811_2 /ASSEMBLY_ACC=CAM_ASM_000667 /LENGTH=76 /DNA_ID=CAMNT_0015487609 /DNA_START=26 /DNA_END=253 /DNA_ORIENTATION=-
MTAVVSSAATATGATAMTAMTSAIATTTATASTTHFPGATSVAEGSFRSMKGLLTYHRPSMDPNTRIGYLLAMVNG